jgi:NADH-quinone oxidoreductase subunit F
VSNQLNLAKVQAAFSELKNRSQEVYDQLCGEKKNVIMVGCATCGVSTGALEVVEAFRNAVAKENLDVSVVEVGCMGHCYAEPMALVQSSDFPAMVYHHLNPQVATNLVRNLFLEDDPYLEFVLGAYGPNEMMLPTLSDLPRYGLEQRQLLRRAGLYDPQDIFQAIALGAYAGLVRAIELGPQAVIENLKQSGLRGMGGAGFPTWKKWQACHEQPGPRRYVICNADEGDPGAFMDRTLLESDPHAIIEGMAIAAVTVGAEQGIIYVRAEYPQAVARLERAITEAKKNNLLGKNILSSGLAFEIELFEGAGAFVCGEESALLASLEGRRGMPRIRPPWPVESGYRQSPTLINNVKSLAQVSYILEKGADEFSQLGTESSKGTAVFALAGKIANPGLVEVAMGVTIGELIFDIGGGIPEGQLFKAVQIGGPSGGCMPESVLDTRIDFEDLAKVGAMMGSGGLVVMDQNNCMVDTARYFLEFTQAESCGKCTFCRIGTKHMLDLLVKITEGQGEESDLAKLEELAEDIKQGSLCNLGKTAPNPVLTTLRFFRDEYLAHINNQTCPAGVCNKLTGYYILPVKCARGCDACVGSCPTEAIYTSSRRIKVIDQTLCINCDSCMSACPREYDAVTKISPRKDIPPSEPRPKD